MRMVRPYRQRGGDKDCDGLVEGNDCIKVVGDDVLQ
jgi:hypothetical protein